MGAMLKPGMNVLSDSPNVYDWVAAIVLITGSAIGSTVNEITNDVLAKKHRSFNYTAKLEAIRHMLGSFGSGLFVWIALNHYGAGVVLSELCGILAALPGWAVLNYLSYKFIKRLFKETKND